MEKKLYRRFICVCWKYCEFLVMFSGSDVEEDMVLRRDLVKVELLVRENL